MNWFLSLFAIAGVLYFWLRNRRRIARHWAKLMAAAAETEQSGDLATAERSLLEADAIAQRQTGVLWPLRMRATKESLARVLFKSGQLQRSATLTFDLLQQLQTST